MVYAPGYGFPYRLWHLLIVALTLMRLNLSDNYFELFGIPAGFHIDRALVESRYRELQSLLHPDRYAAASAQEKRLAAQGAALVNQAYLVLTDDCARAACLLELKGTQSRLESDTMNDDDFLMEQMELRETLEQSEAVTDGIGVLRRLKAQVAERMLALREDFSNAYIADELDNARNAFYRMQFIKKFQSEVADKLRRISVSSESG